MDLKVSIFTNAGTVPLEIAEREGFFAEAGLSVSVEGTTSSVAQMTGVIDGRYDIAATAVDNVIAYNAGQGAAPTQARAALKVFLGSATYRLPFVVGPDVHAFSDLRGRIIAVDALSTGFAFLLREMLEINGLAPDTYEFVSVGAPRERWEAVQEGNAAGSLLNAHFETIAHGAGCRTLTSDPDPWGNYQGNAFCAQPEFLRDGPVEAFSGAVLRAVDHVRDPSNRDGVADALIAHLGGNMTIERARAVADSLQGIRSILAPGLPVSRRGTQEVVRLREKYTGVTLDMVADDLFDARARVV